MGWVLKKKKWGSGRRHWGEANKWDGLKTRNEMTWKFKERWKKERNGVKIATEKKTWDKYYGGMVWWNDRQKARETKKKEVRTDSLIKGDRTGKHDQGNFLFWILLKTTGRPKKGERGALFVDRAMNLRSWEKHTGNIKVTQSCSFFSSSQIGQKKTWEWTCY